MADDRVHEVMLGPHGRLAIPARLRRRLGFEAGEVLLARAEGSRLVLERRNAILDRLRQRFAVVPDQISMVDELIAARRIESALDRA